MPGSSANEPLLGQPKKSVPWWHTGLQLAGGAGTTILAYWLVSLHFQAERQDDYNYMYKHYGDGDYPPPTDAERAAAATDYADAQQEIHKQAEWYLTAIPYVIGTAAGVGTIYYRRAKNLFWRGRHGEHDVEMTTKPNPQLRRV